MVRSSGAVAVDGEGRARQRLLVWEGCGVSANWEGLRVSKVCISKVEKWIAP